MLPASLQTFVSLYGSWLERVRTAPRSNTATARLRRVAGLLAVDAWVLATVIVGTWVSMERITTFAQRELGRNGQWARLVVVCVAVLLAAPFCAGLVRLARRLGLELAALAFPPKDGRAVDFADAPRRVLVVAVQLAVVLLIGAPMVALTQPFLPAAAGAAVLLAMLAVVGVTFWRSATNLEGHVRAGVQVIVEVLASQSHSHEPAHAPLEQVDRLLPGFGALEAFEVGAESRALGKTLAELDVRGVTGATVLAITRDGRRHVVPTAQERLVRGDVLALAGTSDAIAAARALLS
jgi:CPA2 family monovalent cation:H+ antiporter-2